jgi:hypothetical protein
VTSDVVFNTQQNVNAMERTSRKCIVLNVGDSKGRSLQDTNGIRSIYSRKESHSFCQINEEKLNFN